LNELRFDGGVHSHLPTEQAREHQPGKTAIRKGNPVKVDTRLLER
jgi:hypothetical protein